MHNAAEKHDLDILHAHYAFPHATSAWLAKQMLARERTGVVTTLHGTDITLVGQDPSYHSITQFSIQRSDLLTAVSEYLRRETVEHFDVPAERITVVPNFVDLNVYRRDLEPCHRSKLSEPGEKIIMHISNFRAVKRVEDVVRIFAGISRKLPARLVLIGDGPERGRAQQLADELGVSKRVTFLGKQESVAELLACADLFLLTSVTESFGLVALEAMACGVPIVATRVGGIPEVVPEGEAGWLAPIGDIDAMIAHGLHVLEDEALWKTASRAARAAAEQFSAQKVVPQYEACYQEVLSQ
jgi:N-acetyl-alpha-D-glucosaminyl L-malate synthase BshA